MTILLLQTSTLNRNELLRALGRGVTEGDTGLSMWGVAALLAAVLLVGMILRIIATLRTNDKPTPVRQPVKLFQDLLKTVELTPGQRRLLLQVIKDTEIANPTALLISPRLFDATVKHWTNNRNPQQRAPDKSVLQNVRNKLFS